MVKEGIVLGHQISTRGIEVNCNAPKIPWNFYNNFIIYSGYELSQT